MDDFLTAVHTLLDGPERLPEGFVTLDCGSGRAVSIREFVETIHHVTGSRSELRFGALPYRENEIMLSQADPAALRALGWDPQVSLEQGIKNHSCERTLAVAEPCGFQGAFVFCSSRRAWLGLALQRSRHPLLLHDAGARRAGTRASAC